MSSQPTTPLDPITDPTARDVYAHFGLAYYLGECLHRGLCNFYMTSSFAKTEHITRLRAEELLKEAWSLTLGQLAARVRYRLPAELGERLTTAIAQRNFLAHHFWYDRVHLMTSEAGAASLIHELEEIAEALQSLDADIGAYAKPYKERIGLTAKAHQEALRDVLEGRDGGPLWPQRLPRKTERLVRAHHAKVEGRAMLVFEADDSTLWSLCKVGLGWAPFREIGEDWEPAYNIQNHLPAAVNPRPPIDVPQSYEIRLSRTAALHVQPSSKAKQYCVHVAPPSDVE